MADFCFELRDETDSVAAGTAFYRWQQRQQQRCSSVPRGGGCCCCRRRQRRERGRVCVIFPIRMRRRRRAQQRCGCTSEDERSNVRGDGATVVSCSLSKNKFDMTTQMVEWFLSTELHSANPMWRSLRIERHSGQQMRQFASTRAKKASKRCAGVGLNRRSRRRSPLQNQRAHGRREPPRRPLFLRSVLRLFFAPPSDAIDRSQTLLPFDLRRISDWNFGMKKKEE